MGLERPGDAPDLLPPPAQGGAQRRLLAVDPRRTSSAQWADRWLGLDIGSDIALSNAIAREIIYAGLHNRTFIDHATKGFDAYAETVEPYTLERGAALTGLPAAADPRGRARVRARDRALICWTLGITEHHNAVDNVVALINLALLCGHVGRWGSGLNPLRGQNNVQGGGDMGAIPNKLGGLPGHRARRRGAREVRGRLGRADPDRYGWHLTEMFEAMERGELRTLYVIGENPAQSEADINHTRRLLGGLDILIVQDIMFTKTAENADVVLPSSAPRGARRRAPSRAPSDACSACARRSIRPARLATTSGSCASSRAASGATGASRRPRRSGTSCARSPRCTRGMSYVAARGARRHPVAVSRRGPSGLAVPARPAVGPSRPAARRRRSASVVERCRRSRRSTPTSRSA